MTGDEMDATETELLTFDQLRDRIGASHSRVRAALLALDLRPTTTPEDQRARRYHADWIPVLRDWLARHATTS